MEVCEEHRTGGIIVVIKHQHFWSDAESEPFIVGLEDLFDLFTLDGLDVGLLCVLTL
jgi:hypothetical protein